MTNGLSKVRLDRMHEVMAAHVARGEVPGLVTLVGRRGDVHVDMVGQLAFDGPDMHRDALFRITSMTKTITAVAAMTLVEDCLLRLDDPVDRLLPELADRRVLASLESPVHETVPAERAITLRDLLTFRFGFGLVLAPPDTYPIQRAERELELQSIGPPLPATPLTPDEWIARFGTLPLMHQPGERWMYNTGTLVLGVLLARATGQSLPDLFEERVFEPLGMRDTSFCVPAPQSSRFTTQYGEAADGGLEAIDGADGQWSRPPAFPDGSAGLVSTVDDFYAFANMLMHDGVHGSERILSRPAVELLRTDQLSAEQRATGGPILGDTGWGFGVSVVTRRDGLPAVGQYGWDGGFGTSWRNDPAEGLVAILMTQRAWGATGPPALYYDFWTCAYQAIDD
jgi:CubicO group peptidase (beta-lactamase class C family)